jgi:tetratricopeptide (TPR) repeat protein
MKSFGPVRNVRLGFAAVFLLLLPFSVAGQTPDSTQVKALAAEVQAARVSAEKLPAVRALGFELISVARYDDAALVFAALREILPHDQQAAYGGALAAFNRKQLSAAKQLVESAIRLARVEEVPSSELSPHARRESDALVLLAVILAVEGDNAAALKAVQSAVALAPDNFDAQLALGRALFGAGDLANAIVAFRSAITLKPNEFQPRFFLATTLEAASEYTQARAAYTELVRIAPERPEGHLGLGVLLTKSEAGNLEQGIRELSRAVELKGDLYEARLALGRALIRGGRANLAVEHLNRAAELAPNNPEPHYQLSIAYRRLGQAAAAARESAKVKQINAARRELNANKN